MLDHISPLQGVLAPGHMGANDGQPGIVVEERPTSNVLQIAAWPETVDQISSDLKQSLKLENDPRPGRAASNRQVVVFQTALLKFLVVGDTTDVTSLSGKKLADKYPSDQAVCLDLSHSRITLRVSGADVQAFLNRGISIDLDTKTFPVNATANTALESVSIIIHHAQDKVYELYIPRAFAHFIWEWMQKTGCQFGLEVRSSNL